VGKKKKESYEPYRTHQESIRYPGSLFLLFDETLKALSVVTDVLMSPNSKAMLKLRLCDLDVLRCSAELFVLIDCLSRPPRCWWSMSTLRGHRGKGDSLCLFL